MSKLIDLTGELFGSVRVLGRIHSKTQTRYLCECACGTQFEAYGQNLRRGKYKSCGCMKPARMAATMRKFGPHREALRSIHAGMMDRCYNVENKRFKHYGGRGIKVAPQWHDFNAFYCDMEPSYQKGLTLERNEVDGNYEPSNCRWATRLEQNRNQRRTIYLQYKGERIGLRYLAEQLGIDPRLLDRRIRDGWDVDRAIQPPRPIRRRGANGN